MKVNAALSIARTHGPMEQLLSEALTALADEVEFLRERNGNLNAAIHLSRVRISEIQHSLSYVMQETEATKVGA